MLKRGLAYLTAAYIALCSPTALAQEPPKTVHFPSGLELKIIDDSRLTGSDELCSPYIELRRKKGIKLPKECEYYDPNQSGNPLLEIGKDTLNQQLSPHIKVRDFAKIGKDEQLRYARRGEYWRNKGEYFYKYIRVDSDLLERLEKLHEQTNVALPIIDAFRSFGYNTRMYWALGKVPTSSHHSSGDAVDIRVNPRRISTVLNQLFENDGLGIGGSFIHVDTRGKKARWYYNFGKKKKK